MGDAHAPTAAAGDRFDEDRVADFGCHRLGILFVFDNAVGTGRALNPCLAREGTADVLVFESHHGPGAGADEPDIAAGADFFEVRVLGEEAVAGVDGIDISDFGGANDAIDAQIALRRGSFTDADGFVGHVNVHRIGVSLGIDGYGSDVEFLARADDADGDFTAIGDEDLLEHDGGVPGGGARGDEL
jgi:hypothetical protein